MNAALTQAEPIYLISIGLLIDSPFQKPEVSDRGDVDEMAASMRELGVLEPLIVRERPPEDPGDLTAYEVIAGHRRQRAAAKAGLETVPCRVVDWDDNQVLAAMLIENGEREDVPPLAEADHYAMCIERGWTVEQIADKTGRTVSHIALRLKLCSLHADGRKALADNPPRLTLGAALAIARLPPKMQAEVVREVLDWHRHGDDAHAAASAKAVHKLIADNYLLRLDTATFPLDDAKLVKKAGACTTCPKSSATQSALFPDAAGKAVCTDPACFKTKTAAHFPVLANAAREAGQQVLEGEAATKAISGSSVYAGGAYVRVDQNEYVAGEPVPVSRLIAKTSAPITIAQGEGGEAVQLVKRSDYEKAKREAHPKEAKAERARDKRDDAAQKKREAKERAHKRAVTIAIGVAVEVAEERAQRAGMHRDVGSALDIVTRGFIVRAWADTLKAVCERRGIAIEKKQGHNNPAEDAVLKAHGAMLPSQRAGLAVELGLLVIAPSSPHVPALPIWKETLESLGVNLDKCERQAADEAKARGEKKRPKKGGKAAPAVEAGTCSKCLCDEHNPCINAETGAPCAWANREETLCTECVP